MAELDSRVTPHPSVHSPTPTLSDLEKARDFLRAWFTAPPGGRDSGLPMWSEDAWKALAQAFSDERGGGGNEETEALVRGLRADLDGSRARLRTAIGLLTEFAKPGERLNAFLDEASK